MELLLKDNIPFIAITVVYKGAEIEVSDILIDTGSATTILSTDIVTSIGIVPLPEDILHTIRGVGGREAVFRRTLEYLQIGDSRLSNFADYNETQLRASCDCDSDGQRSCVSVAVLWVERGD